VFLPVLCRASKQKWKDVPSVSDANPRDFFSPNYVDNFLLECIVALELNARLTKLHDADSVFACKRILPIFVDDDNDPLSETAANATIEKAEKILQSLNVLAKDCNIERFVHGIAIVLQEKLPPK